MKQWNTIDVPILGGKLSPEPMLFRLCDTIDDKCIAW